MAEEPAAAAAADIAAEAPAIYELVNGEQIVEAKDTLNKDTSLQQILHWIGFTVKANRDNLQTQLLGSFDKLLSLTKKDCQAIATDWSSRTVLNG